MKDPGPADKLSFDEFKLFYETTEKVTDRRIEANRWNYSICAAIIAAVGVIINWGLVNSYFFFISAIVVVLLSGMAALYCTLWIGQIRDLKELNNAKFKVLNAMAPLVSFGEAEKDKRISYCPFEREWIMLEQAKVAKPARGLNLVALSSTRLEIYIPNAIRVLFLLVSGAVAIEAIRRLLPMLP